MRILIVEDEEGIAAFLKQALEEESYAVEVAIERTINLSFKNRIAYLGFKFKD